MIRDWSNNTVDETIKPSWEHMFGQLPNRVLFLTIVFFVSRHSDIHLKHFQPNDHRPMRPIVLLVASDLVVAKGKCRLAIVLNNADRKTTLNGCIVKFSIKISHISSTYSSHLKRFSKRSFSLTFDSLQTHTRLYIHAFHLTRMRLNPMSLPGEFRVRWANICSSFHFLALHNAKADPRKLMCSHTYSISLFCKYLSLSAEALL